MDLIMIMDGNDALLVEDESSDDSIESSWGGDVESNASVYGSASSNEGDDDYDYHDPFDEAGGHSSDGTLPDDANEAATGININPDEQPGLNNLAQHDESDVDRSHFNADNVELSYATDHNCAHNGQVDGVLLESASCYPQHVGMPLTEKRMLPCAESSFLPSDDGQGAPSEKISSLQNLSDVETHFVAPRLRSNSAGSEIPAEHGMKRNNVVKSYEDIEIKRVKKGFFPFDKDTEIRKGTDGNSAADVSLEDKSSNFNSLPDDMLLEIFGKLNTNTLINIAPVCKRWYELSKHKSLWSREDAVYDNYHLNQFIRAVRAARYLRTVDVSGMHATHGEVLLTLLKGPESVRRFCCFCVAHPRVIVELLERYKHSLEELNISLSDERLSFGEGGTFKDGVKPRPGFLLKLISEMKNLRVLRFTGKMPSIGQHQGRVNPKWYFGELESLDLKLQAVAIKLEKPREILLKKFVVPFLRSKIPYLKELRLTSDIWRDKEIQEIVTSCPKLEALVRFPIDSLHALENCKQQYFIDFIIGSWIDFKKIELDLINFKALSHIHEVSLRFCDQLHSKMDDEIPDTRLESFLPTLAGRLQSCKRVHIYRWDAFPSFVESVHSTCAFAKFLYSLRNTLEEVHIYDAFRGGKHYPKLMRAIRDTVPHLKSRGIAVNRLGNRGLLFSIRKVRESVIPNTTPLLLEHGSIEFGSH